MYWLTIALVATSTDPIYMLPFGKAGQCGRDLRNPLNTSPSASARVLPCSRVISLASSFWNRRHTHTHTMSIKCVSHIEVKRQKDSHRLIIWSAAGESCTWHCSVAPYLLTTESWWPHLEHKENSVLEERVICNEVWNVQIGGHAGTVFECK